nr:immunoglobulin heavy chain junction region [Mus musculus]MBK4185020.1 immunoglobulin heavy chain junction region [Mus musculus]MBK4185021.1 immunoglobulin heavy chain junction region [Mus musculus]MBK4185022.1 immunoglobulin heavy chain junction region [Mus musculus]MBK4187968.1 immunoglobulin heavy chain junction region [Mus musculus]
CARSQTGRNYFDYW